MSKLKYKSKDDVEEAAYVVPLISSSAGYINRTQSETCGISIERTSDSYKHMNESARRGAQLDAIGMLFVENVYFQFQQICLKGMNYCGLILEYY